MYHRVRRKMRNSIFCAIVILSYIAVVPAKSIDVPKTIDSATEIVDDFENNVIDFDEQYSVKLNKKYDSIQHWNNEDKKSFRYTFIKKDKDDDRLSLENNKLEFKSTNNNDEKTSSVTSSETTTSNDYTIMPLELLSTTENPIVSLLESTAEQDLTVIPLSTTKVPKFEIKQTIALPPTSTQNTETTEITTVTISDTTILNLNESTDMTTPEVTTENVTIETIKEAIQNASKDLNNTLSSTDTTPGMIDDVETTTIFNDISTIITHNLASNNSSELNSTSEDLTTRSSKISSSKLELDSAEVDPNVPIFTELDSDDEIEVPEDYYDSKDIIPTPAPKTDALSVIFGFAGSVVESVVETVAEKVVPKGIYDLFKRMQKQNEALEAERLRSREENGGLGQFGRGILKSISSGLTKPLNQLMAGVRDIGSLDSDRGFVSSLATGMTSVANAATSLVDVFKDRRPFIQSWTQEPKWKPSITQIIFPSGTVWCGGGHAASARSGDLGLFFFTDTCCRQHDACKIYIKAGETKYGLTNTGLFTRSHCSCDAKFHDCLKKTNSLVSSQIGWTYFNVLGPQCFRKAHPIVRCVRRTRITGQKCEEYELDYTKPKMWQWFDTDTM